MPIFNNFLNFFFYLVFFLLNALFMLVSFPLGSDAGCLIIYHYITVAGREYLGMVRSEALAVYKVTTSWGPLCLHK